MFAEAWPFGLLSDGQYAEDESVKSREPHGDCGLMRWRFGAPGLLIVALPSEAMAHASERGHVMLMPTSLYILGGALAVMASMGLAAIAPTLRAGSWPIWDRISLRAGRLTSAVPSLFSLVMILGLVAAGFVGPADPISNPLPGTIWTLWWTGFTIAVIALGNLWATLNPWTGIHDLAMGRQDRPMFRLPSQAGQWPAVLVFICFAWFELIHPTPFDPVRLAHAASAYLGFTFIGLFLFGRPWLTSVECFSVYFGMVSKLSPLQWRREEGCLRLAVGLPGWALLRQAETGPGTTAFVLLALSTVSFDGFMRTFLWTGALGLNPLEFPGRSAVMLPNSLGLLAMFAGLACIFWLSVRLGQWLSGEAPAAGLVWSVVPIAFAYHLAHYLPEFPVSAMQAVKALSDPFGTGLDIFGTAGLHPPASIMMDHHTATFVYRLQVAIIVAGHMLGVAAAHVMALRSSSSARTAIIGQVPLNVAMVFYTMFGLWLLSTPVIG